MHTYIKQRGTLKTHFIMLLILITILHYLDIILDINI